MTQAGLARFQPFLMVRDAGGQRQAVTLAQLAPDWQPSDEPVRSATLFHAVPWATLPEGTAEPDGYPVKAANPFEMIGRNVDVGVDGASVPAVVSAFHGALDLTFSDVTVRVRHMLEITLDGANEAWHDRVFGVNTPSSGLVRAGAVVSSVAPLPDGEAGQDIAPPRATLLVGLVVGRSGNRLVVAPVRPFLDENRFELLVPDAAPPDPAAEKGDRTDAAVHQLRDAVLTIQRRDGFLFPDDALDDYHDGWRAAAEAGA